MNANADEDNKIVPLKIFQRTVAQKIFRGGAGHLIFFVILQFNMLFVLLKIKVIGLPGR